VTARGLPGAIEGGPNLTGLVPALLVFDLPNNIVLVAERLGIPAAAFQAVRGNAFQAELELPPGRWRFWPSVGAALWVGYRPDSFPAAPSNRPELDLSAALVVLAADGLWPSELRVLDARGWTPVIGAPAAARALALGSDPIALFGVWSDQGGRALRACIFRNGEVRAGTDALAERLLILLGKFNDD
jgi:hypothetical protein